MDDVIAADAPPRAHIAGGSWRAHIAAGGGWWAHIAGRGGWRGAVGPAALLAGRGGTSGEHVALLGAGGRRAGLGRRRVGGSAASQPVPVRSLVPAQPGLDGGQRGGARKTDRWEEVDGKGCWTVSRCPPVGSD